MKQPSHYADLFNRKLIKRGIIIFVSISVMTLTAIFMYNGSDNIVNTWAFIKWYYLLFALFFVTNDLLLGGLRNHIFLREFVPDIKLRVSVAGNLANIFMGAVTPSQSGGGPAQIYYFYKNGVSIIDSISASFFNFISTIVFFPLSGALALFILKGKSPPGFVMMLTTFGFRVFCTLLIIISIALFMPRVMKAMVQILAAGITKISVRVGGIFVSRSGTILKKLEDYRSKYFEVLRNSPLLMLYSFGLTIVLYFNKYMLAFILLLAFGMEVDFWEVIAIHAVLYLLLYFSPSPGGSGIAELGIAGLMSGIVSGSVIGSYTLLYRSLLVYIPAILGSFVIIGLLNRESRS